MLGKFFIFVLTISNALLFLCQKCNKNPLLVVKMSNKCKWPPFCVIGYRGDATQTGHILGRAERLGPPGPERDMSLAYCAATRLLLHMAMFLGSATARGLAVNYHYIIRVFLVKEAVF